MVNPPVTQKFLNTKEAAAFLGCSEYTLRAKRTRRGRGAPGPAWHEVAGGIRYRLDELEAYLVACRRVLRREVPAHRATRTD